MTVGMAMGNTHASYSYKVGNSGRFRGNHIIDSISSYYSSF